MTKAEGKRGAASFRSRLDRADGHREGLNRVYLDEFNLAVRKNAIARARSSMHTCDATRRDATRSRAMAGKCGESILATTGKSVASSNRAIFHFSCYRFSSMSLRNRFFARRNFSEPGQYFPTSGIRY